MKIESCTGNGILEISYTDEEGKLSTQDFTDRVWDLMRQEMPWEQGFEFVFGLGIKNRTFVQLKRTAR